MSELVRAEQLRVMKAGNCICELDEMVINRGERVLVVGDNGSGKTTLLRVLAALETDFSGQCHIGTSRDQCVYVHQTPYMFRGTVLSNTTYGLAARRQSRASREEVGMQWLTRLGIDHIAGQRATSISGGEMRRIALARAFVLEPTLLLLDEPFAELDDDGVAAVWNCLDVLRASSTIVIASPTTVGQGLPCRMIYLSSTQTI